MPENTDRSSWLAVGRRHAYKVHSVAIETNLDARFPPLGIHEEDGWLVFTNTEIVDINPGAMFLILYKQSSKVGEIIRIVRKALNSIIRKFTKTIVKHWTYFSTTHMYRIKLSTGVHAENKYRNRLQTESGLRIQLSNIDPTHPIWYRTNETEHLITVRIIYIGLFCFLI